jgi:hypothetical protein
MIMSEYNNNRSFVSQQTVFGLLCVFFAALTGCWFVASRIVSHVPATETIVIELPETESRPAEFVEVIREKPERKYYGALLHPFGFMILVLSVILAGTVLIVWVAHHGRQ